MLSAARLVDAPGGIDRVVEVLAHSAVVVVVCHLFHTLFAWTAISSLGHRLPLWLCAVGGCLLASVPETFFGPATSWILGIQPERFDTGDSRADFRAYLSGRGPWIFLLFAALGTSLWMLLNFNWMARVWRRVDALPPEARARPGWDEEHARRLVGMLPEGKRAPLMAISAELHYVRLRTEAGSDLVLMPFGAAISPFAAETGMRIHRSHWVRRDAVRAIRRVGNGLTVRLRDGTALPVSRSFRGAVLEAWPDRGGG